MLYADYEAAFKIAFVGLCVLMALVIYLRDRLVPHFTKESFLFILCGNLINVCLVAFYYEDLPVFFNLSETGAIKELERFPLTFNMFGALLSTIVFAIGRAYIWSISGLHALIYIPFYIFCIAFIFSPSITPRPIRAIILIGNYLIIGMFACTLLALTVGPMQFHGLTQVVTVYQVMASLASFFILYDMVPRSVKKGDHFEIVSEWKFYADRFIDDKLSYLGLCAGFVTYAASYVICRTILKFELFQWNMFALTSTMIITSLMRSYMHKRLLREGSAPVSNGISEART